MALKKNSGRQELIVAHLTIGFADPTYGTAEKAIELPGNAVIVSGAVTVGTPWNSATAATLKLGDASDDDRYTPTPIDLKTAGRTALVPVGLKYTTLDFLTALVAQTGTAATAGSARIDIQYYVEGRAAFAQG